MKKTVAAVLCLLLAAALALPADAAASGKFLRTGYDITRDTASFYGRELPAGGELQVTVDGKDAADPVLMTLSQSQTPVTVYCLVDASTALSQKAMKQQRDILLTISSRMGPEDNMVLALVDKSLQEGKILGDKDARRTAIEAIQRSTWYCNLLQGISEAMDSLSTGTSYHTNRCLLILSDGRDSGRGSVTAAQVQEKIAGTTIPVYSVVVGSDIEKRDLKQQTQFADSSLGGFACRSDGGSATAASAADQIWDSISGGTEIRIARADLGDAGVDHSILMRYEVGNTRYEDSVIVRAMDIQQEPAEPSVAETELPEPELPVPETAPTAIVETEPAPTETAEQKEAEEEDDDGLPIWLYAVGGAGIVILVAVAALLVTKKKPVEEHIIETGEEITSGTGFDDKATEMLDGLGRDDNPGVTVPVSGGCTVSFVAIMHPEVTAQFRLAPKMETTFGRDSRADAILNANDRKLSGVHGSLLWDGKMLLIRDKGSTNGTMVNEEHCPCSTWLPVEDGAKIRAGGFEYRVNYEVEE